MWSKAVRVMGYVLLASRKIRGRSKSQCQLTATDLSKAESMCIKMIQNSELVDAKNTITAQEKLDIVSKLGLSLDNEQVIRCGGRLRNADLPPTANFPILLPRKHHATKLLIMKCHATTQHSATSQTLIEVRRQFG